MASHLSLRTQPDPVNASSDHLSMNYKSIPDYSGLMKERTDMSDEKTFIYFQSSTSLAYSTECDDAKHDRTTTVPNDANYLT